MLVLAFWLAVCCFSGYAAAGSFAMLPSSFDQRNQRLRNVSGRGGVRWHCHPARCRNGGESLCERALNGYSLGSRLTPKRQEVEALGIVGNTRLEALDPPLHRLVINRGESSGSSTTFEGERRPRIDRAIEGQSKLRIAAPTCR